MEYYPDGNEHAINKHSEQESFDYMQAQMQETIIEDAVDEVMTKGVCDDFKLLDIISGIISDDGGSLEALIKHIVMTEGEEKLLVCRLLAKFIRDEVYAEIEGQEEWVHERASGGDL